MSTRKGSRKNDKASRKAPNVVEARSHLDVARTQWEKAAVESWEPADPAACVSLAFYSYENAVVAAAEAVGEKWEKKHYMKAEVAKKLASDGVLKTDVSERLHQLNNLRKDVAYGEPGSELAEVNLEDLVADLENFIDAVDEVVSRAEEESDGS